MSDQKAVALQRLRKAYLEGELPPEKVQALRVLVSDGRIPNFFDDVKETPVAVDLPVEAERAKRLAGQSAGVNIQSVQQAYPGPVPMTDETPSTLRDTWNPDPRRSQQFLEATRGAVTEFDRRRATAESGVVQDQPLPASSAGIGLSNDKAFAVRKALADHFKQDVPVRTGPVSGKMEYLDPESRRFTEVNPDMLSKAGLGITAGADVAGTIAGGVGGALLGKGHPAVMLAGEAAGSGAGTTLGETLRLGLGKALGYNDLEFSEIMANATSEGSKAAGITFAFGGTVIGAKALSNYLSGRTGFSKTGALEAGMSTKEADALLAEVNKLTPKTNQITSTMGRRSDDVNLRSVEGESRSHKDFAKTFRARDVEDQKGLSLALDNVTGRHYTPETPDIGVTSAALKGVRDSRKSKAAAVVSQNRDELERALGDIDARFPTAVGKDVRSGIEQKKSVAKGAIDSAYDKYRKLAGEDPDTKLTGIEFPLSRDVTILDKQLSRESRDAITSITKKSKSKIFNKKPEEAAPSPAVERIFDGPNAGQLRPLAAAKTPPQTYDLRDYNIALGDLKRAKRTVSRGGNYADPSTLDMDHAIAALTKARSEGLIAAGKEDVLQELLNAEAKRSAFADVYEKSVIGNLLYKDGVSFKVGDESVIRTVLNGSVEDAEMVVRAVGDNFETMTKLRQGLSGAYTKQVLKSGYDHKAQKVAHDEFLASHGDVLQTLFGKDYSKIEKLGGISVVVKKQEAQLTKLLKNVESTWGTGKLASLDPERIIKFIQSEKSFLTPTGEGVQVPLKKARYLMHVLHDKPGAIAGLRSEVAKVTQKGAIGEDGLVSVAGIDRMLNQPEVIEAIMGKQYVKDLLTIRDTQKLLESKLTRLGGNELTAAVIQGVRGVFAPPLSRKGRIYTAFLVLNRRDHHKRIAEALMDPKELHKIARLAQHSKVLRESVEIAASVGMILSE